MKRGNEQKEELQTTAGGTIKIKAGPESYRGAVSFNAPYQQLDRGDCSKAAREGSSEKAANPTYPFQR